jgi:hypothetical protein
MNGTNSEVSELIRRWTEAESGNDPAALDGLLANDFTAVGPRGFVLTKDEWLERYRSKSLQNTSFALREPRVRDYGGATVVVGTQAQSGSYQGHDSTGVFRATLIAVSRNERWLLAGIHLSPVAREPS